MNESVFDGGLLLLIMTFGIYGFWVGIAIKKWEVKHTHFAN